MQSHATTWMRLAVKLIGDKRETVYGFTFMRYEVVIFIEIENKLVVAKG